MKLTKINHQTHRRGFLGIIAAGAAALGLSTVPGSVKAGLSGMESMNTPQGDLEEWFGMLKGDQKIVFDVPHPNQIFPFAWPKVFLMSNEKAGTPVDKCSALVVLRHSAIGYAFDHSMWKKYKFGEFFEANDHLTNAPAVRNPFQDPAEDEYKVPGFGPVQIGIKDLQEQGVMFCVCEMAMAVNAAIISEKMNMTKEAVLEDWSKAMLPGIKPVPSGVYAIGNAQKHGCGYCFAG